MEAKITDEIKQVKEKFIKSHNIEIEVWKF